MRAYLLFLVSALACEASHRHEVRAIPPATQERVSLEAHGDLPATEQKSAPDGGADPTPAATTEDSSAIADDKRESALKRDFVDWIQRRGLDYESQVARVEFSNFVANTDVVRYWELRGIGDQCERTLKVIERRLDTGGAPDEFAEELAFGPACCSERKCGLRNAEAFQTIYWEAVQRGDFPSIVELVHPRGLRVDIYDGEYVEIGTIARKQFGRRIVESPAMLGRLLDNPIGSTIGCGAFKGGVAECGQGGGGFAESYQWVRLGNATYLAAHRVRAH